MPLDFTVIVTVRQRFGDANQDDFGQETDAPFVGQQKDFSFGCPNVDRTQQAILLFQSQGANVHKAWKSTAASSSAVFQVRLSCALALLVQGQFEPEP